MNNLKISISMKTRRLFLLLSILMLSLHADSRAKETNNKSKDDYDVYLLIGQSNMAGRGTMLPEDQQPLEHVWLLNDEGEPVPATNPLNQYSSVRKDLTLQQIGPGYAFAATVAKKTGHKILLVVNALGGSNIHDWEKNAGLIKEGSSIGCNKRQLFGEAVRRGKQAQKYGTIKGILWHQGESNHDDIHYTEILSRIMSDLRKALDTPDAVVVAGQIAQWMECHREFNERIRRIAEVLPNSTWVSSEGLGMLKERSDPHFSRDGQLILGERYAEKILEMCYPDSK